MSSMAVPPPSTPGTIRLPFPMPGHGASLQLFEGHPKEKAPCSLPSCDLPMTPSLLAHRAAATCLAPSIRPSLFPSPERAAVALPRDDTHCPG